MENKRGMIHFGQLNVELIKKTTIKERGQSRIKIQNENVTLNKMVFIMFNGSLIQTEHMNNRIDKEVLKGMKGFNIVSVKVVESFPMSRTMYDVDSLPIYE
jgi:hypothetical protein